jgi:hypothetical protein
MLANVAMVILDTLPVHPSQELRLLRTSNQNSGTETKELHSALHPPVRHVSERERERERQKSCTASIILPWPSDLVLSPWWQVAKEEWNCVFELWVL